MMMHSDDSQCVRGGLSKSLLAKFQLPALQTTVFDGSVGRGGIQADNDRLSGALHNIKLGGNVTPVQCMRTQKPLPETV